MKVREDHKTKIDYRTSHDPFNNYESNYNKLKIKMIDYTIFKKFMPYDKCFKCKGPNEEHIPICHVTCQWWWHQCGKDYFVCESKGSTKIKISKTHLVYNYMNRFPFIFRFGAATGISIHHINMNEEDDTPSNLIPVLIKEHSSLHAKHRNLISKYKKLLCQHGKRGFKDNFKDINEMNSILIEIEKIKNEFTPAFERIYEIYKCINFCIETNEIYVPEKEWISNSGAYLKGRKNENT